MPPKVLLAVLCKRTSQDEEGFLNLHSIVHGVTILDEGPPAIDLLAVIKIMSDEPGLYPLRVEVVSPSGQSASGEMKRPLQLEAYVPRTAALDMQIQPDDGEGLYWLEVEIGEEPMTRIPLGVRWAPDSRGTR